MGICFHSTNCSRIARIWGGKFLEGDKGEGEGGSWGVDGWLHRQGAVKFVSLGQ